MPDPTPTQQPSDLIETWKAGILILISIGATGLATYRGVLMFFRALIKKNIGQRRTPPLNDPDQTLSEHPVTGKGIKDTGRLFVEVVRPEIDLRNDEYRRRVEDIYEQKFQALRAEFDAHMEESRPLMKKFYQMEYEQGAIKEQLKEYKTDIMDRMDRSEKNLMDRFAEVEKWLRTERR